MNQTNLLRRLSGRKRLEQAFKFSDFVRELALKNIQTEMKIFRRLAVKELMKRMSGVEVIKGNVVRVAANYLYQT